MGRGVKSLKDVLLLMPKVPYPPYEDGTVLIYYYLTKYVGSLNIICFGNTDNQEQESLTDKFDGYFKNHCSEHDIQVLPIKNRSRSTISVTILNGYDIDMNYYYDQRNLKKILDFINDRQIRVVLCNIALLRYAEKIKAVTNCNVIIHSIDAKSMVERSLDRQSNLLQGFKAKVKYSIYSQIERRKFPHFDSVIVVSEQDKDYLVREAKLDTNRIQVIPNGVDTQHFSAESPRPKDCQRKLKLGYSGILNYKPNEEAVLYFLKEIYPEVLGEYPNVEFWVIGKNPTESICAAARPFGDAVKITGFVDDIRPYISSLDVYISPLRSGGGIKNKVLEAMALGVPVVASVTSMAGIEYSDEVKVYSNKDEAIRYIAILINSPELRVEIKNKARKLIQNQYSWRKRSEEYASLLCSFK